MSKRIGKTVLASERAGRLRIVPCVDPMMILPFRTLPSTRRRSGHAVTESVRILNATQLGLSAHLGSSSMSRYSCRVKDLEKIPSTATSFGPRRFHPCFLSLCRSCWRATSVARAFCICWASSLVRQPDDIQVWPAASHSLLPNSLTGTLAVGLVAFGAVSAVEHAGREPPEEARWQRARSVSQRTWSQVLASPRCSRTSPPCQGSVRCASAWCSPFPVDEFRQSATGL